MVLRALGMCRDSKALLMSVNSGDVPDSTNLFRLRTHLLMCRSCRNGLTETAKEIVDGCQDFRDALERVNQGEDLPWEDIDLLGMHLNFCRRCRNRLTEVGQRKIENKGFGGA